jgi:hypothetical protein
MIGITRKGFWMTMVIPLGDVPEDDEDDDDDDHRSEPEDFHGSVRLGRFLVSLLRFRKNITVGPGFLGMTRTMRKSKKVFTLTH